VSTFYEEIPLAARPAELLDTIRRSAASQKWRVIETPQALFVTDGLSTWKGHTLRLSVWVEASPTGSLARFLAWPSGRSDGEMRRLILKLIDLPAPVYGPPGAPVDPTVPRDLYRPLGTGGPAPAWVGRTRLLSCAVGLVPFAAFVAGYYFWGLVALPLLWLAAPSVALTWDLMFHRALHIRSHEGLGYWLISATPYALTFTVFLLLNRYHPF
jgi:hypothetical protein